MTEEWRPVVGYEDLYSVSSEGRVRRDGASVGRKSGNRSRVGVLLKPQRVALKDYLGVRLSRANVVVNRKVATLVAEAFISPRPSTLHGINHKNGVHQDNRVENLEWATDAENNAHALLAGLHRHSPNARPKLTAAQATEIRAAVGTQRAIAARFGVSEKTVRLIQHRRIWKNAA